MELKPGYKQTEVGVIPEEWEPYRLKDLADIQRGASPRPIDSAVWYDSTSDVGWVRISDVTASDGKHLRATTDYFSKRGVANSRYLPSGSLIMSICATVGMPVITRMNACIHDGFVGFTKLRHSEQDFLYYKLKELEPAFKAMGQTGSQANLNSDLVRDCLVALPPLPEQHAIARALGDVDALLGALTQLIAKKSDLKQAAMQQLLTGQTRLPGFGKGRACRGAGFGQVPADWTVTLLRSISTMNGRIGWQGLKQEEFTSVESDPFLITGMNFEYGEIRWNEVYHIPEKRYEEAKPIQLRSGDILMTKDGTIGKLLFVDTIPFPGKASLNSHLLVFRPLNESYVPKFLFYELSSKRFADYVDLNKSGTTFFGITQEAVGNYPACLPSIEEQTAITAVLSDMDAELAGLRERVSKTRALKQGMMQELLTGRTRLV